MRHRRIVLTASLLALGLTLGGCESFDPTEWFNTKKPLPGERKAVFPEGVPGVPQGVPPELVEGYKPSSEPPPQVVEEKPKPKPKAKPKPKPQQAAEPAAAPPPRTRVTGGTPQPAPAAQGAWPDPQQTAGQPAPAQGAAAPFPDPPRR
jgi:hypothetical protein